MTLNDWKISSSYFNYRGNSIFIKDEGRGDVLVLVHGFPTSSWDWHKQWETLAKKFRVITLDMIGFGFSDKPTNYNYSLFDQANLYESFFEYNNINKFHILAHDYGDTVVQELLARTLENNNYKYKIQSVCFLNGGMFPETNYPTITQKLLLSPFGFLLQYFMGKQTLAKNFNKIFGKSTKPSALEINDYWESITYNNGKRVLHKIIKYLKERETNKRRWQESIQLTTSIPKLLIDGGADPISGRHMADFYSKIIPDANVVILEGIGHYPQIEAPKIVLELYIKFNKSLVKT